MGDGFHSKSIVEQEPLFYSLFDVYSVKCVDYDYFNGGNDDES